MRIVIDLQALQTPSRFRGVGRYVEGLAKGIIRNRNKHEVFLALNGSHGESARLIRNKFGGLIPEENFLTWYTILPLAYFEPGGKVNREIGNIIHSSCILDVKPDFVLYGTILADFTEVAYDFNFLIKYTYVANIIYDFIPYKHSSKMLGTKGSPLYKLYMDTLAHIKNAHLFFSISKYVEKETKRVFDNDRLNIINIDSGTDNKFYKKNLSKEEKNNLLKKFELPDKFILYAGGCDDRKNIILLLNAYQSLPDSIKKEYSLVIVNGKDHISYDPAYTDDKNIHFFGYLLDDDLINLYNLCYLFVFTSLEEGFGLTPLEAMRCGAPVLVSNATSLPEVVGCDDALFDPNDTTSLRNKILKIIKDDNFRNLILRTEQQHQKKFSWDNSAIRCLSSMESFPLSCLRKLDITGIEAAQRELYALSLSVKDLPDVESCIARTFNK